MSKTHTIYVIVDADGKYIDAYLSFSEASLHLKSGQRVVRVFNREDY